MSYPDLSRIVEAYFAFSGDMLSDLRSVVLPTIRRLQQDHALRWYCFLLHPMSQLSDAERTDQTPIIHLRLEIPAGCSQETFLRQLPPEIVAPHPVELPADISGVDTTLLRCPGATGWKLIGDCSEWVLCFVEAHSEGLSFRDARAWNQAAQYLHFITNALGIGQHSILSPFVFLRF